MAKSPLTVCVMQDTLLVIPAWAVQQEGTTILQTQKPDSSYSSSCNRQGGSIIESPGFL